MIAIACALARAAAPETARAAPPPPGETIAEAMFLCDALPPGGRDLILSVGVTPPAADAAEAGWAASPRLQVAVALGERLGLTADVGLGTNGAPLDAPGASLKLLLRAPAPGRTGLALSLDLYGGSHDPAASEGGLGLGVIRTLGRLTLRAGGSVASPVGTFGPHLPGGTSAAVALGARVRVLGELVAMASARDASLAAGPTVKVAIAQGASLSAGVLFPLAGAPPAFTVQLAQGL